MKDMTEVEILDAIDSAMKIVSERFKPQREAAALAKAAAMVATGWDPLSSPPPGPMVPPTE